MITLANFQMGKAGLTDQFIEALRTSFKTHKVAKIAILQTATRDREEMKKMGEQICEKLDDKEFKYEFRTIGFTMTVRKFKRKTHEAKTVKQ
jgi:RNA-binding protein YhbY